MTLAASKDIIDLPNTENTREDDWYCRVMVSYNYSVMVFLVCHTYPMHSAVNDISDGPTRFPEAITYDEYVVHPNPACNVRLEARWNVKDMQRLTEECNWDNPSAKYC